MIKKFFFLSIFLLLIFVVSIQANASYVSTSTLAVGNTFTFSIPAFNYTYKINGTNYAPSFTGSSNPAGKSYNVKITSITNSVDPFFNNLTQKVGYSVNFNGSTHSGTAYEDEWFLAFFFIGFATEVLYNYSTLQTSSFQIPSSTAVAGGQILNTSNINNLPFFLSGNQTFYNNIQKGFKNYSNTTTSVSSTTSVLNEGVTLKETTTNTSVFDYEFSGQKRATTTNGVVWSYSMQASFKVTMDLTHNVIADLRLSLNTSTTLGTANSQLQYLVHIIKGTISTPGFEIILFAGVFVSVSAIVVIRRKMVQ